MIRINEEDLRNGALHFDDGESILVRLWNSLVLSFTKNHQNGKYVVAIHTPIDIDDRSAVCAKETEYAEAKETVFLMLHDNYKKLIKIDDIFSPEVMSAIEDYEVKIDDLESRLADINYQENDSDEKPYHVDSSRYRSMEYREIKVWMNHALEQADSITTKRIYLDIDSLLEKYKEAVNELKEALRIEKIHFDIISKGNTNKYLPINGMLE